MGYSCTVIASEVEEAMLRILQAAEHHECGTSNGWTKNGVSYFIEQGRENDDGAITGTVMKMCPGGTYCHRVGGARIEPDGHITRWPTSTQAQRQQALEEGTQAKVAMFTYYG